MKNKSEREHEQEGYRKCDYIVIILFWVINSVFFMVVPDDKLSAIFHTPINTSGNGISVVIKEGILLFMLVGIITQKILYAVKKVFKVKIPHYAVVSNMVELFLSTLAVLCVYIFIIRV